LGGKECWWFWAQGYWKHKDQYKDSTFCPIHILEMRAAFYSAQSLHKHIQWRWMQVITDNLVNCFMLDVCLCLGNI
jgi:hypothetical protein